MNRRKHFTLCTLFIFSILSLNLGAQVTVNDASNSSGTSAILEISSDDKGMLMPRMSSTEKEAIASPAIGMMVFDTTESKYYYYNGNEWTAASLSPAFISDNDLDTRVEIEELINSDEINFEAPGGEPVTMNNQGIFMATDVYIGREGNGNTSEELAAHPGSGGSATTFTGSDWQSFISNGNFKLDYIELVYYTSDVSNVIFTIYEGEGDQGIALGSVTLNTFVSQSWNEVDFSQLDIFLRTGNKYTIGFSKRRGIVFKEGNPYADGTAGSSTDKDYRFRAYGFATNYAFSVVDGEITKGDYENQVLSLEDSMNAITANLDEIDEDIGILENLVPIGTIQMWPTASPPADWLICDGSAFDSGVYPDLSSLLGGSFLPNFSGRFPIGLGSSGTQGATSHVLFEIGGFEKHLLSIDEMPAHSHEINYRGRSKSGNGSNVADLTGSGDTATTDSAGGDQAHNNMPPFYTINFIVKAK